MKLSKLTLLGSFIGALLVMLGCGAADTAPSTNPAIRGSITNYQALTGQNNDILGLILIEGKIESDTTFDKAAVTITNKTRIFEEAGQERRPSTFEALRVGQQVEAWFDGPVAESYPVQARASDVVILK